MFATKNHNPNESHSTPHVHDENTSHVYAWVDNHDDQTLFVESACFEVCVRVLSSNAAALILWVCGRVSSFVKVSMPNCTLIHVHYRRGMELGPFCSL